MTLITLAEWNSRHWWYRQLTLSSESSAAMPTVEERPCRARAICRDSLAASAGSVVDVQIPGVAGAGTEAGVTAALGVAAAVGVPAGPEGLAGAEGPAAPRTPAAPGAPAGPGASAVPRTSKAASAPAPADQRRHPRTVITRLRRR